MFHTIVYPGETLDQAIVRAACDAQRNGFRGYVVDCETCGQPIQDHEIATDCETWLKLKRGEMAALTVRGPH